MANFATPLNVYEFGPEEPPPDGAATGSRAASAPAILALHGLTGHGLRWQHFARDQLADYRVIAPDLRGHGRSPWVPPWTIEQHVADLTAILRHLDRAVIVGHSFGGNLAVHLSRAMPERVAGLVLLDPAVELEPAWMLELADATTYSPDYTDRAEARSDKLSGAWRGVAREVLERELDEHLVTLPTGRVNWRIGMPAVIATFGELARTRVLPPTGTPTVLVVAKHASPPFVTPAFRAALAAALGNALTVFDADTDHMVAQEDPLLTGRAIRTILEGLAP
ncbi:alpha/beta hydrolase [Hoyosella sp. YIM 151337]|uniref:alpha/beta fold hydrolase n=1 Tax=Hoyosella sp. YIM 151337 TaxID=2992742 RepID=UPI00223559B4|nr:alpha/beta hydrolase [Hoyosella sp. YIM 151337]MCW4352265.1 alpha/beta hydrolase [Hoyosella sp. YIM 151337]